MQKPKILFCQYKETSFLKAVNPPDITAVASKIEGDTIDFEFGEIWETGLSFVLNKIYYKNQPINIPEFQFIPTEAMVREALEEAEKEIDKALKESMIKAGKELQEGIKALGDGFKKDYNDFIKKNS